MKKSIFVGMLFTGVLLAGCGDDESAQQLAAVKQQHAELETKYENLSTDYAKLQEQYEEAVSGHEESKEIQQKQKTAQALKEHFAAISPKTPQGPYQALVMGEEWDCYKIEQMMLSKQPTEEENAFELAFQQLFPQLTFNEVIVHDNDTITIDFHENSTGSPNLTATGQVEPFFDMLEFFLYYNFPNLKAYYLYSNGEPTGIGEADVFTEAQPNDGVDFENLYLDLDLY